MKEPVVITRTEYAKGEAYLTEQGGHLEWFPCEDDEPAVARRISETGARIAVLGTTRYHDELYRCLQSNSGAKASLIVRWGVGIDGIDPDQCEQHNVLLANTPGTLDEAVAEHTIALLLCIAKSICRHNARMHAGEYEGIAGFELHNRSLGIAGFGNIGKRVAGIASRGFGMKIQAFDVAPLASQSDRQCDSQTELLRSYGLCDYHHEYKPFAEQIDILSIHMPLTDSTKGFFNLQRLQMLRRGSVVINTSRGALLEEEALYSEISNGRLAGAALDVYSSEPYEPISADRDLRNLPNIVLTPHVASNTIEVNRRVAEKVLQNVSSFLLIQSPIASQGTSRLRLEPICDFFCILPPVSL